VSLFPKTFTQLFLSSGFDNLNFLTSLKKTTTAAGDPVFNWGSGKPLVLDDIERTEPVTYDLECGAYKGSVITFVDCTTPNNFICETAPV